MRPVLPWIAVLAMAALTGWVAYQQTDLQNRIATLELARQHTQAAGPSGAPKVSPWAAARGPKPPESPEPAETRRQLDEMRSSIQSLQTQLVGSRQEITAISKRQADAQAAATARDAALAFFNELPANQNFAGQQVVPHYTGGPKRSWGHEQATGAPDTAQAGDLQTAWASKIPDGGVEWLELDYERAVSIDTIRVVESHNPGAISKVSVIMPDGREETVWEGNLPPSTQDELVESDFKATRYLKGQKVRVYVDTGRVPGWNEIDAVQLIGKDGTQQWAVGSTASSSYSDP